ncbi:MAG: hypothetical protein ACPGTS_02430 [Minisyncoccia bacterium]
MKMDRTKLTRGILIFVIIVEIILIGITINAAFNQADINSKNGEYPFQGNFAGYRVGDAIAHSSIFHFALFLDSNCRSISSAISRNYPGSLGDVYLKRNPKFSKKFHRKTFEDVVAEKCPDRLEKANISFNETDLVIHLRLGDAVEKEHAIKMTGLPSSVVKDAIDDIFKREKIERVFIIFGKHLSKVETESLTEKYLNEIVEKIKLFDVPHEIISSDPDTDLCALCLSPHLLYNSKSSFSYLASLPNSSERNTVDAFDFQKNKDLSDKIMQTLKKIARNAVI